MIGRPKGRSLLKIRKASKHKAEEVCMKTFSREVDSQCKYVVLMFTNYESKIRKQHCPDWAVRGFSLTILLATIGKQMRMGCEYVSLNRLFVNRF